MFTGIVEEVGRVVAKTDLPDAVRLTIQGPLVVGDASHGDSIAVNGVCLTVVQVLAEGRFTADVMAETLNRSTLGDTDERPDVNLERSVTPAGRLGGHIVQGHVDGTGIVISRTQSPHWEVVRMALPDDLARYVVEKGSIAVDGVSLTVSAVGSDAVRGDSSGTSGPADEPTGAGGHWFEVSLIPTTLTQTTLGGVPIGGRVNLEVDVIAKYVEKLLPPSPQG